MTVKFDVIVARNKNKNHFKWNELSKIIEVKKRVTNRIQNKQNYNDGSGTQWNQTVT